MKHVKKITVAKASAGKSNVFDDIANWFDGLGGDHKIKW
jgi:hypothetical protein